MALTRKKYVLDKKFQVGLSLRAIVLPLLTTIAICGVLLFFAGKTAVLIGQNSADVAAIIDAQGNMLDIFMSIPALQDPNNPMVKSCDAVFKKNLQLTKRINDNHEQIRTNSSVVLYILILLTVIQAAIIFFQFIFFSHRITGPLHVMSGYLRELRSGNRPVFRPLRKTDELREFYDEFCETVEYLLREKKAKQPSDGQ